MSGTTTKRDWLVGLVLIVVSIASYELLNHVGRNSPIDMSTDWDYQILLLPVFVIPYLSFISFVFLVVPVLARSSRMEFFAYLSSLLIAQLLMNVLYMAVPATVPRPQLHVDDLFSVLLRDHVWRLDEPVNTFPSNQVAFSILVLITVQRATVSPIAKWLMSAWLMLICLSTLLVHQHVLADVIGGALLAVLVAFVVRGFQSRKFGPAPRKV